MEHQPIFTCRRAQLDDEEIISKISSEDNIYCVQFGRALTNVAELLERSLCCFCVESDGLVVGFAAFDDCLPGGINFEPLIADINSSLESPALTVRFKNLLD